MTNCNLYNGQNLDGTGSSKANPYQVIQNAGKKRRLKKKSRSSKTSKRRKSTMKKKTKCRKGGIIQMAYRYFNIY